MKTFLFWKTLPVKKVNFYAAFCILLFLLENLLKGLHKGSCLFFKLIKKYTWNCILIKINENWMHTPKTLSFRFKLSFKVLNKRQSKVFQKKLLI